MSGRLLAGALVTASPISGAVAFACAYAVGALPVAWLLARRRRGVDLRRLGGTGALEALRAAGPLVAVAAGLVELLKGAGVGLAATFLGGGTDWFTAAAIAGCVVGDAFPPGFRRGGSGLVPLVSGMLVALPLAGFLCALIAVPVALLTRMRGRVYGAAVIVAVPLGLLAGTLSWQTLPPAAAIVLALLGRSRLRRAARARLARTPADASPSATIIDQPPAPPSHREL